MRPLLLADGEGIEQRLRGMLVRAVAGIDDAGLRAARARNCAAPARVWRRTMMSAMQRLEIQRGVLERLAFGEARLAWRRY